MRRWMVPLVFLVACDAPEAPTQKEAPTKEAPTKEAPTKEAPTKEAPTKEAPAASADLAAQAARFVEAPGTDSAANVDWPSVTRTRTLAVLRAALQMSPEERDLVSPGEDPVASVKETLAELDHGQEGAAMSATFTKAWAGTNGCTAKTTAEPWLAGVEEDALEGLPSAYLDTLRAVRSGAAFDVACGSVTAKVALDEKGRVIAMEPPEVEPDDVGGNRFADMAND